MVAVKHAKVTNLQSFKCVLAKKMNRKKENWMNKAITMSSVLHSGTWWQNLQSIVPQVKDLDFLEAFKNSSRKCLQ